MSFRASLKNLIRRDAEHPSLRERAADLQADLLRVVRQPVVPAAEPAPNFADQVAQAGPDHDVLAGGGIDHRDGTVSYADASGKVSRRPMAHWIGFNALQMHNRVQQEMGRRRIIEANPLPAEEYAAWEARIRRELRSDAVHALAFRHDRAFEAAQAIRTGVEPATRALREQADAELLALAPVWEEAVDFYQRLSDEESLISETASEDGWPGPAPAGAGPEWRAWFQQKEDWRERSGVASAEEAASEAGTALHKIEMQIAELPAASLAGLRLKARVGQRSDDIGVTWPEGLSEGLARDLLAFGADGLANENPAGDALLLQLGRQFEAARKREIAACEACNAAQREADRHMPDRPAALLFRSSDHPLRLGKFLTHPDDLEGTEVTADDVAWMKRKPYVREVRRPVRPEDNLPADAHTVVESHPWPEAQERADEIVTAWDRWCAAKATISMQYLPPELDDAANDAGDAGVTLAERIAALPAHTAEGFRVKLRALSHYRRNTLLAEITDDPDPDQLLSHSLWRDVRGEAAPAIKPTLAAELSPVFVTIADGTRSAADNALSDARVSPDLRKAVEAHRDATLAMLLDPDLSDEAANARCAVVDQAGDALRAVPARSLADVRCKLAFLLPEILPDVNGSVPTAFLENIRDDVDRLAQQPEAAPRIGTNLVDQVDFASATLEDLRALYDLAGTVGDVAYAMAWTGAAHADEWSRQSHPGEHHNAAGKLMQWLGEALADVADATRKEVQRRQPETPSDRETRLTILSRPVIQNGDPDETEAFARDLAAHVEAERAGR
ncbi:hypothetical protein [Methylobacterium sp. WL2]|uniref:hypothetical protein n=1 Tax=Methylobacterium sp. WL2 TaxID=2603902 RepID=UPI0011CC8749|nr:hypothetical protein [Methylobacterium sp. WL2]TXN52401.1 hypothetical protein FV241_29405 [Methylobacterium sp. WL2]